MKIDLDPSTLTALSQIEERIANTSGMKPRSKSILAQVLLQWTCEKVQDSDVKGLAPKTLSLAQRRKLAINEMRAFTGQIDAQKLDKLMRTIQRLKQPTDTENKKDSEKDTAIVE